MNRSRPEVLIAGGEGMLARDVAAACAARGHGVSALGRSELDVTDGRSCERAIAARAPDIVIDCAAWTDVDGAETDEAGAMRVNDTGAGLLAVAAADAGAAFVYISSDFVFDGHKRSAYVESDGMNALSAYGRSKQAGETAVAATNPRSFILRTAWLFGNRGHNFVETMLRLGSEQSEILVVSDQHGCPTYAGDLAAAIAELSETESYGVHHLAGAGEASWYEFAEEIFDQAGVDCRVIAATTDMVPRPARRPKRSVLRATRDETPRLPAWQDGLAAYLAERERVRPPIGSGAST